MLQIIGILVVAALAVVALKIVVVIMLMGGIIFRTKPTLGLIAGLGALALLRNYPAASYTVIGVLVIGSLARMTDDEPSHPPDRTTD